MSPKPPVSSKVPKINLPESPSATPPRLSPESAQSDVRDLAPGTSTRLPANPQNPTPGQEHASQSSTAHPEQPSESLAIGVTDLPARTPAVEAATSLPMSAYLLAPASASKLPAPNAQGFRMAGKRRYVDVEGEGTVQIGLGPSGNYQARLSNELIPSGPQLQKNEGRNTWSRFWVVTGDGDSRLVITRHSKPSDEQSGAGAAALDLTPAIWKNWGSQTKIDSPDFIEVAGRHYPLVPRGSVPDEPIVYIQDPARAPYGYESFESMLKDDPQQQPRGAIRVPPADNWEIDPNLPFKTPLTTYVAKFFPELSEVSLQNVARKQFFLANQSDVASGSGLTTLRQTFNDWEAGNITPRSELADPLLMLPVIHRTAGTSRKLELPAPAAQGHLERLDFDPKHFAHEWRYFISTQSALDLKRFMSRTLTRNGYTVFAPTPANSFPTLVFRRTGHDFVFFLSLRRVKGFAIYQNKGPTPILSDPNLVKRVGAPALRALHDADRSGKVIWLQGGYQQISTHWESVFIVREDRPGMI